MKKILISIILVFIFALRGLAGNDCLPGIKARAAELKKYQKTKATVLNIVEDIIKGLKECGFPEAEIKPFKTLYKKLETQITKLEKEKKDFPTPWYSKEFLRLISDLESRHKPGKLPTPLDTQKRQESKKAGTAAAGKTTTPPLNSPPKPGETGKKEIKKVEPGKKESPLPATGKETPGDSSFMSEGFVTEKAARNVESLSVITANELKTKLDVVEKKLNNLSETLHFYQIGFIALIIGAFLGLGLMALFILYWRKDYREILRTRSQMWKPWTRKDENTGNISSTHFLKQDPTYEKKAAK